MTFISGWWVSGYSKENASACEDTKNAFTTCEQSGLKYGLNATSHVDANGQEIEKCRRHDERIDIYKRYAEYYDACNVKRTWGFHVGHLDRSRNDRTEWSRTVLCEIIAAHD